MEHLIALKSECCHAPGNINEKTMQKVLFIVILFLVSSCAIRHSPGNACCDGRDRLLQLRIDSVITTIKENPDILVALVTIAEVDCGKVRSHKSFVRCGPGIYKDTLDLSNGLSIMPGAIIETATLAHMLERYHVSLEKQIPTNHGLVDKHYLPRSETIKDYEYQTGEDSISVRQAYLKSYSYLPYYFAQQYLLSKEGYNTYVHDLYNYFLSEGHRSWVPTYGSDGFSDLMPYTVASGHSIFLTHKQMLNFYCMIANGGIREGKRVISETTADTLSSLLRDNVLMGAGYNLSKSTVPITGKPGYGIATSLTFAGTGAVNDETLLKKTSFVGFYPSNNPKYAIAITLMNKNPQLLYGTLVMQIVERIANGASQHFR